MLFSCLNLNPKVMANLPPDFEVIGHRGHAGKLPENSLPAFIDAVKKGVDAIELDVVVSADRKLVVSHEPYMASDYMLDPNGNRIAHEDEKTYNLYKMDYELIRRFDSGSGKNLRFSKQKRVPAYKPLLSEMIDSVENYIEENDLPPVKYYVEIKSEKSFYGKFQPYPEEFVELMLQLTEEKDIQDKLVLQSFDINILEELHQKKPDLTLSYLVEKGSMSKNLKLLSFQPTIYSPYYKNLRLTDIALAAEKGIRVIPWTVNEKSWMKKMIKMGVDGIITDYPQKLLD